MNKILKSMAIGLSLITGSQAMEASMNEVPIKRTATDANFQPSDRPQKRHCLGESIDVEKGNLIPQDQKTRELTPTEKKNAHKIWLMKQSLMESNNKGTLPEVHKDIQIVIGQTLHELSANPVLDGMLVYTDKGKKTTFNIMDLIKKDSSIDLSETGIFGDSSDYFLITTDPEAFFRNVKNSYRLAILIAPRFLIKRKIETSAQPFQKIMANWEEEHAPIGIFYRVECWENLNWYDYLTNANLIKLSKNNLYAYWYESCTGREYAPIFIHLDPRAKQLCQKFSCSF